MAKIKMKQSVIFVLLLTVSHVQPNKNNNTLFPQLLFGEYQMHAKSFIPCDPMRKNKYQINVRMNRISATRTEIEGNLTITDIPFNDDLMLKGCFDQKDSYGGWISNSVVLKKDKACLGLQSVVKEKYYKNLGCGDICVCPLSTGVYMVKNFPANNLEKALNFPKIFFYGTYRFRISVINKKNEEIGCLTIVIEIKRPWEQL